jgi:glyoxylase-like metal-dependent hydrolase (beta-lactamase superfamily II)
VALELVTTDGIFALDGGSWEVTNNIWLIGDDREVMVFDAAHDHKPIVAAIGGRRVRDAVDAPVYLHPADRMLWDEIYRDESPDRAIEPGTLISAGGHDVRVLHTPGHSPGCCCFHDVVEGLVISGDTLFCGGPGATGRSYSDEPTIVRSIIDRLLSLPDHTDVHTGHGEDTTIGEERERVMERAHELGLL